MFEMKTEEEKRELFWEEFRKKLGERLRPRAKRIVETFVKCEKFLREEKYK